MTKLPQSFKVCQNCVYWNGQRKIDGVGKITESISSDGKCACMNGFFNLNMKPMATCPAFKAIF